MEQLDLIFNEFVLICPIHNFCDEFDYFFAIKNDLLDRHLFNQVVELAYHILVDNQDIFVLFRALNFFKLFSYLAVL